MPTHHSYIDLDDKDTKKKVLDYTISVRDAPVRNPLAFDRVGYIDEGNKKINGFIILTAPIAYLTRIYGLARNLLTYLDKKMFPHTRYFNTILTIMLFIRSLCQIRGT